MFERQRDVKLVIRDPETPGGFKLSMAWRPVSRSVTADAMVQDSAARRTLPRDVRDSQSKMPNTSDGVRSLRCALS